MTKADRIRYLASIGLSNKEILPIVTREMGRTHEAYVRVVTGQRPDGQSVADQNWHRRFSERHGCSQNTHKRRTNEAFRRSENARHKRYKERQREMADA